MPARPAALPKCTSLTSRASAGFLRARNAVDILSLFQKRLLNRRLPPICVGVVIRRIPAFTPRLRTQRALATTLARVMMRGVNSGSSGALLAGAGSKHKRYSAAAGVESWADRRGRDGNSAVEGEG